MALATVCIPGEFRLYLVGSLGGRCGLFVRVYWGVFLGPLVLQGERVVEDRDKVNGGGDHIGAAAAASG